MRLARRPLGRSGGRKRGRARSPAALALTALALGACARLPELAVGACGNGVVEAGEDCDTFASEGLSCRARGELNACRFACSRQGGGPESACPAGWGCGVDDGICRAPSGTFEP